MVRSGGVHKMPFEMTQQRLFMHDPQDPFMVDFPSSPLQSMGHPTIAIAWKIQDDLFYSIAQRHRFSLLRWLDADMLSGIVPGAIDPQQLAEMTDGKGLLLLTRVFNYRLSLLQGSLPNAFFSSVFSRANCPQKRSNSAILASADGASDETGGRNASSPR